MCWGWALPPALGIIPNAFVHIFNHISVTTDKEFLIRASFIEIYNEEVRDLLGKVRHHTSAAPACVFVNCSRLNRLGRGCGRQDPEKKLDLKEDPEKGVYVKDLTAVVVKDYAEIDEVMKLGNTHRTVGATAMVRRLLPSAASSLQADLQARTVCTERRLVALPLAIYSRDRDVRASGEP